jgi:threonine/homoserine/homoserine lactone efflux protein
LNFDLFKYAGIGAGLAFTAAVQPGPLQAYLFSSVTTVGWKKTLPASFSPLLSDGPIAVIALLIVGKLPAQAQSLLRLAGGLLLFYLAWRALKRWKETGNRMESEGKRPRTLLEAAGVNLLNPHPYLGWSLILGPVVISAWRESPGMGIAVVASFYVMMICMLAVLIFLFGSLRLLGPKLQRSLGLLSALILAGLGIYQLAVSISELA